MSLLEKASIVTTPTAYGVGVLNSIKPAIPFGEELIVNGNFQNGSTGWSAAGTTNASNYVEITENGARLVTDGTGVGISQTITTIGKSYKLTFNVTVATLGSAKFDGASISFSSVGSYSKTFVATQTGLTYYRNSGAADITVNNVSVKEVTDADFDFTRTSSATRVNPDYLIETVSINSANLVQNGNFSELGSELVTNGNFETDSDWTKGSGWSISGGKASHIGSDSYLRQNFTTTSGKIYKVAFTVSDYTSGDIRPRFMGGTAADGVFVNSNGTYTQYIKSNGNTSFRFQAISFTGSIDNVSVKQVDPNDNWTLGTGWSFGTNKAICDGSSTFSDITQSSSIGTNLKYKVTYTILDYVSGSVKVIMNNNSASGLERNANGTYSDIITSLSNDFSFRALGSGFNGSITNVSVIEIQENGVPRLDYTNGTASILLELASTNLETKSNGFSTWTLVSNVTRTADYTLSPEGVSNATRLQFTSNGYVANSTITSGTQYTVSIYAKRNDTGTQSFGFFVDGSGAVNSEISLTSEWKRFSFTHTATNGSYVGLAALSGADVSVYGFQLEVQSYPTSYIPTSGSSVTRAAETLNNAGNSDLINSTEGVLYAEISALANPTSQEVALCVSEGQTGANRLLIRMKTNGAIGIVLRVANTTEATIDSGVLNQLSSHKVAVKWKVNDIALWIDGVEVGTDNLANVFSANTLDEVSFNQGNNSNQFYGKAKTVAVFKEALSDTELACLTSTNNREIFLNYYYRMQYVGANTEALSCAEQTFNI